jgi:hypothetical protein
MVTTWNPVTKASGTSWTDVPKSTVPSQTVVNDVIGVPIGLLLALTYSTASSVMSGGWKNISKAAIPNSWTNVPKAV